MIRFPKILCASYDPLPDALDVIPQVLLDVAGSDAAEVADAETRGNIITHSAIAVLDRAHALYLHCDQGLFVAASDWPAAVNALEAAGWSVLLHPTPSSVTPG